MHLNILSGSMHLEIPKVEGTYRLEGLFNTCHGYMILIFAHILAMVTMAVSQGL